MSTKAEYNVVAGAVRDLLILASQLDGKHKTELLKITKRLENEFKAWPMQGDG